MKCSVKSCLMDCCDQLAVIDDGLCCLLLCPSHQIDYVSGLESQQSLMLFESYPTLGQHHACEICGEIGLLYANEVELYLCHEHLLKLIKRKLCPAEYKLLVQRHGTFHAIRDELYVGGGYAIQPIRP